MTYLVVAGVLTIILGKLIMGDGRSQNGFNDGVTVGWMGVGFIIIGLVFGWVGIL